MVLRTVFLITAERALLEKIAVYYREMNGHYFDKLPDQSVVVIDNAISTIHDKRKTLRSQQLQLVKERRKFRNGWQREESVLTQMTQFLSCSLSLKVFLS